MKRPPCCNICRDVHQSCSTNISCCLECHAAMEENIARGYLPPSLYEALVGEHEILNRMGWPHRETLEHSRREEEWFRAFLPAFARRQIEEDHRAYLSGELGSRLTER